MHKGYSFVELLIVIITIGILAAIAYPGYRDYITRVRRSDGKTALLDLANRMERSYLKYQSYQKASIDTGEPEDVLSSPLSPEGWYNLSIKHADYNSYLLQATPIGSHALQDKQCQSLTLNNLGVKGITMGPAGIPTGNTSECW